MQSYDDLVHLARLCGQESRISVIKEAAAELWRMAEEYQRQAARLDGGKLPEIGKPPLWVRDDVKNDPALPEG